MLSSLGKVSGDTDFIFYGQMTSACGSVGHTGDNRTGAGDGEALKVDLSKIPERVQTIAITVTIYDLEARR